MHVPPAGMLRPEPVTLGAPVTAVIVAAPQPAEKLAGKDALLTTAIVDAPGVRDFAPPASVIRAAEQGFIEIHERSAGCRFNDCRHLEEPGCAVRAAVLSGGISRRRYESYRRLFRLYEQLAPP